MNRKKKPKRDTKAELKSLLVCMAMAANDGFWPMDFNELWDMGVENFGRFCKAVETLFRPESGSRIHWSELKYFDTVEKLADYLHDVHNCRASIVRIPKGS